MTYVQIPGVVAAVLRARDNETGRVLYNTYYMQSPSAPVDPDVLGNVAETLNARVMNYYCPTWQPALEPLDYTLTDLSPGAAFHSITMRPDSPVRSSGVPAPKAIAVIWRTEARGAIGRSQRNRMYLFPTFQWAFRPDYPHVTSLYYDFVQQWKNEERALLRDSWGWRWCVYSRVLGQAFDYGLWGWITDLGNRAGRRKEHGRR